MLVAIADLGVGNLRSVEQAVKSVASSIEVVVTSDSAVVDAADKLVLPGQGAIGTWFSELDARGLRSSVQKTKAEKPLLGICVGMQAMFDHSDEDGGIDGFGWYSGTVNHFGQFHDPRRNDKIPHMGWNRVKQFDHPLWQGIDNSSYFYFVHSYCANVESHSDAVRGTTDYQHEFIAAIGNENVFATQFHPEKSHNDGLTLIRNFVNWNGNL